MLQLQELIVHYGYFSTFIFLALGIFGLPVPDEIIVAFIGHLSAFGTFNYFIAMILTILGVMTGTIFTYTLGRKIGKPLIQKYGKWISLSPKRLKIVERYFEKYGALTVTIGYFVPGMRHIVCYLSGTANMEMKTYLLFAAIGTFISSIICLSIGYFIKLPF